MKEERLTFGMLSAWKKKRRKTSKLVDAGSTVTTGMRKKEIHNMELVDREWQPTDYSTGYAQPRDSTAPTKDSNAPFAEDCATCITL